MAAAGGEGEGIPLSCGDEASGGRALEASGGVAAGGKGGGAGTSGRIHAPAGQGSSPSAGLADGNGADGPLAGTGADVGALD